MLQNVFRRAWFNTILKEKDFDCLVENIDEDIELTIADDFLEKEEEESLIQKFSEMEIEEEDQEVHENSPKKSKKESKENHRIFQMNSYFYLKIKKNN